jgi:ABC-type multidrug transport system fused ATPase/permease subunit
MAKQGGRPMRAGQDEDLPKAKLSAENFKKSARLFNFIWQDKWKFLAGMFFLLCTALVGLAFPIQAGKLFGFVGENSIDKPETIKALKQTAFLLFSILALQGVFSFGRVYFFTNVAEKMLERLRNLTYERVLKKPMSFFTTNQSSELSSRISTDINVIGEAFTLTIAEFFRQIIVGIGGLIMMISVTPFAIAKWFLITIPPIIIIAILFAHRIRKYSKEYQDKIAESNAIIGDSFTGIVNVKTFTNEQFEINKYQTKTNDILNFGIRYGIFRGGFFSFVIMCVFGSVFFILFKMLELKASGAITSTQFGQFMMLALFVSGSLGSLPETIAAIQRALGATDRVFELIDEEVEPLSNKKENITTRGEVSFEQVDFTYASRPNYQVLKNISLAIANGETLALVGSSGSGKSTLANLLLRFYKPTLGKILLNGVDIQEMELTTLRSQIAYVPQEVLLFSGTIAENIAYGQPSASASAIEASAAQANALDFIQSFPEGMHTKVGERGIQLSGGQRQRIAIARAVLKNPSILILDEATSSLDSESERIVQDAIDKLMHGRTSIVIAHRLSTIKKANKIAVLHKGELVELGTHESLSENKEGLYYKLSQMQVLQD